MYEKSDVQVLGFDPHPVQINSYQYCYKGMFSAVFISNYDQHCLRSGLPVWCVSVASNVSKLPSSLPPHPHATLLASLPLSYRESVSLGAWGMENHGVRL